AGRSFKRAVDRATCGREDEPGCSPTLPHTLHEGKGTEDVHACVIHRVGHALAHVDLRGEVADRIVLPLHDLFCGCGIGDVQVEEFIHLGGEVLALPRGQVVEDVHLPAFRDEKVGNM